MTVQLIVRFAPGADPARQGHSAPRARVWMVVWAAFALLLLAVAFGCTSGGGPAAAATASATGAPSTSLVQANGRDQKSANGALENQAVIGEDLTHKTANSGDTTLQNRSGFYPTIPPGGF